MNKARLQKETGARIRAIRKGKNITLLELATSSGKASQVIQRIETGQVNPEIYTLKEIAGGLGIELEKLLAGL